MGDVVFRLDDVQDGWLVKTQLALFELFSNHPRGPLPMVLGVIASAMKPDSVISSSLKRHMELHDLFEIACHGYHHHDFSLMNEVEQEREFEQFQYVCRDLFPTHAVTSFIPPYNRFNTTTVKVAKKYGYQVVSSLEHANNRNNLFNTPSLLNCTVSTSTSFDEYAEVRSAEEIIRSIKQQLQTKVDWCVVMLHPQEFGNNSLNDVDLSALNTLRQVIDWCLEQGHCIKNFSALRQRLKDADYVTDYLNSLI